MWFLFTIYMPKTLSVWIVLLYFSSPHYSFSSPHLPEAPSVGVLFFVVVLHSCTFLWYHLWLSPPLSLWGMTGSYGGIWGAIMTPSMNSMLSCYVAACRIWHGKHRVSGLFQLPVSVLLQPVSLLDLVLSIDCSRPWPCHPLFGIASIAGTVAGGMWLPLWWSDALFWVA